MFNNYHGNKISKKFQLCLSMILKINHAHNMYNEEQLPRNPSHGLFHTRHIYHKHDLKCRLCGVLSSDYVYPNCKHPMHIICLINKNMDHCPVEECVAQGDKAFVTLLYHFHNLAAHVKTLQVELTNVQASQISKS